MDADRPHRSNSNNSSGNTSSELFICFNSRLSASSSSMKIPSKSILSPGRAREPSQVSLSTSLSRRLRSNGSMKGGQASPMFPTTGKKRGAFENPEPSSPKVTCIGQVRVKTKKQGKKMRTRSQRRGEVSFRRVEQIGSSHANIEASSNSTQDCNNSYANHQFLNQHQQQQECLPHRNQRWVHLPVTICEALREFNCFLPCRSSCMANEKDKEDKPNGGSNNGSSCGAAFVRWLVALQEGDGKGREIELVVGDEGEEEREEFITERRSYRRHVFEEIEFKEEKYEVGNGHGEEEEARVSICIPPKNALLLMRCRSDPVKMAALANKFWEAPVPQDEDEDDEDGESNVIEQDEKCHKEEDSPARASEAKQRMEGVEQEMEQKESVICEKVVPLETIEVHQIEETESGHVMKDLQDNQEGITNIDGEVEGPVLKHEEETELNGSSHEEFVDQENFKILENEDEIVQENEDNQYQSPEPELEDQENQEQEEESFSDDIEERSVEVHAEQQEPEPEQVETQTVVELVESKEEKETTEKINEVVEETAAVVTVTHEGPEEDPKTQEGQMGFKSKERESSQPLLPDCLLLMMCEPKLSMEVSKETWVCSTDFIRHLPEQSRQVVNKTNGGTEPKKRISIDSNPAPVQNNLQQPPRSSCSYPAKPPPRRPGTESMATMIEQKLVGAKAYEPFVLTRCKSEPMRTAAKLAPEACFWKNRKLEPHRPATVGIGAAGVGF